MVKILIVSVILLALGCNNPKPEVKSEPERKISPKKELDAADVIIVSMSRYIRMMHGTIKYVSFSGQVFNRGEEEALGVEITISLDAHPSGKAEASLTIVPARTVIEFKTSEIKLSCVPASWKCTANITWADMGKLPGQDRQGRGLRRDKRVQNISIS